LEQARSAAIAQRDTATLRRIYADDFRGVTAAGFAVDRARLLGVFTGDESPFVFTIDEIRVQPLGGHGGAAVYTARLITKKRDTGEAVTESRFTHAYEWRDGRWQIVAAQGTTITRP
jgi:ketosteroid isomerase-like protein